MSVCPSLSGALEASQRPRLSGWSHPPAPCYPAHVSPSLPLLSLCPLSWGLCRVCTSLSVPGGPARLQAGSVRHTLLRAPAETPLPAQACVRHPAVWGSRLSAPAPPQLPPALPPSLPQSFLLLPSCVMPATVSELLTLAPPVAFLLPSEFVRETFRVYIVSINKPCRAGT